MKHRQLSSRWSLVFRLLLAVLIFPTLQGCRPMMYPAARAFGGPKESELKRIRPAFAALKTQARVGAVVVYRPLVVKTGQPSWDDGAGTLLVEAMHQDLAPRATLAPDAPDVPFEPMGHNQMRYLWKRARGYASWVGSRHPAGDYFVFTELLTDEKGERVLGAQCYIVDASGQIAQRALFDLADKSFFSALRNHHRFKVLW